MASKRWRFIIRTASSPPAHSVTTWPADARNARNTKRTAVTSSTNARSGSEHFPQRGLCRRGGSASTHSRQENGVLALDDG